MAYDLMAFFDKSVHEFRILLKSADNSQNADLDVELAKNTQETPTPDPRAVFEDGLDDRTARVLIRREPDVGQDMFGCGVAFEDAAFAAGLDVQIEIDRNPGVARPPRVRWMCSVALEIAARAEITALRLERVALWRREFDFLIVIFLRLRFIACSYGFSFQIRTHTQRIGKATSERQCW